MTFGSFNGFTPRIVWVATLAASLSGCAPDAWNAQPGYDAFMDTIETACPQRIGGVEISSLENNDASFLDINSRLYYGKINEAQYRQYITSFYDSTAETQQAIGCIVAHLPKTPPPAPGMLPNMGSRPAEAPPPPAAP